MTSRIATVSICLHLDQEDPEKEFMPSTGRIETFEAPCHKDTRVDSGFKRGNLVEPWYDPMLSKVIVKGSNREDARNRLIKGLKDFRITESGSVPGRTVSRTKALKASSTA